MYRLTHVDTDLRNRIQEENSLDKIHETKDKIVNNDTKRNKENKNNDKKDNRKKAVTVNGVKDIEEYSIDAKKYNYGSENLQKGTFIDNKE